MGVSWVAEPRHEIPVEAMPGFCMSYRREALAEADIWFDEALGGYADGEDVDVSVRVGRRYPLWQTPKARLVHHRSRAGRATMQRRFFTRTRNEHYLQRKLFPPTLRTRLAWWWGAGGRVLVAALVGLRQGSVAPLRGTLAGLFASPPDEDG
jgi:GT2 family glycosyltransferase